MANNSLLVFYDLASLEVVILNNNVVVGLNLALYALLASKLVGLNRTIFKFEERSIF